MHKNRHPLSLTELAEIVATNDKKRFEFSNDHQFIRARQGHSLDVALGYEPVEPAGILFHGTPIRFIASIRISGLKKQTRHHVHLHENEKTATEAGGRRGKPALLIIRAREMHDRGFVFFRTDNKVWLTDHVPPEYIEFPD